MPSFCFSKHPLKVGRTEITIHISQMQKQRGINLFTPGKVMAPESGLQAWTLHRSLDERLRGPWVPSGCGRHGETNQQHLSIEQRNRTRRFCILYRRAPFLGLRGAPGETGSGRDCSKYRPGRSVMEGDAWRALWRRSEVPSQGAPEEGWGRPSPLERRPSSNPVTTCVRLPRVL